MRCWPETLIEFLLFFTNVAVILAQAGFKNTNNNIYCISIPKSFLEAERKGAVIITEQTGTYSEFSGQLLWYEKTGVFRGHWKIKSITQQSIYQFSWDE